MTNINRTNPTILGGTSIMDKLSKAKRELNALQEEPIVEMVSDESNKVNDEMKIPQALNEPKFHLTGRCNRKDQKYITKAFYILEELDKDIKQTCNGGDVALFNYLIYLGLNEIKKRNGHSFDEISKMEKSYS